MRRLGALLVAAALTTLTTACSVGGGSGSSDKATPTPEASTSPSATPAPAPVVGQCRRLPFTAAAQPEDDAPAVPCTGPHTSQTVKVGRIDRLTGGEVDVGSAAVRDRVAQACPERLLRLVGGDETARRLSRFEVVWFVPTTEQAKAGATWFRCDVVGLAAADRLIRLPRTVKGVLDAPDGLDRFGTCGTKAPGKRGFVRVVCRRHHAWRAVDTVDLDRSARYLGAQASAQGDAECKDVAAARAGGALRYTWSFEWPTRDRWRAGQRFGYCWVPG